VSGHIAKCPDTFQKCPDTFEGKNVEKCRDIFEKCQDISEKWQDTFEKMSGHSSKCPATLKDGLTIFKCQGPNSAGWIGLKIKDNL
jgi:hypothetical protein